MEAQTLNKNGVITMCVYENEAQYMWKLILIVQT